MTNTYPDMPKFLDRAKSDTPKSNVPSSGSGANRSVIIEPVKAPKSAELKDRKGRDLIGKARKAKKAKLAKAKAKKPAPNKAKSKKPTKKAARNGTKRERLIAMLKRPNGASLGELLKANPLAGKTPLATISAKLSVLRRDHKIVYVEGSGEKRRFRIA